MTQQLTDHIDATENAAESTAKPAKRSRRRLRHVMISALLAVASAIGLLQFTSNAGAASTAQLRSHADYYMSESMSQFLAHKRQAPRPFNWQDDGCSNVPDRPYGYNFKNACARHDFGYRNYGRGLRLDRSEARRYWIDATFYWDMARECQTHRWMYRHCMGVATAYYQGVRRLGGSSFFG
jgi:hypothetical protein